MENKKKKDRFNPFVLRKRISNVLAIKPKRKKKKKVKFDNFYLNKKINKIKYENKKYNSKDI